MDDPKIDVPALLSAIAAAGLTATFTLFPRDLSNGEPAELMGLSRVLELPEGSIMSDAQAEMADYVIVGGVVVKNRNGPVYTFERGREAHAMVCLGTKFDIGQRVGFLRKLGDVHIAARGEIMTITQYRSRAPVYCITLDVATQGLFGGVVEVYAEEAELYLVDVDAGAEDPDARRQAEPGPSNAMAETAELEEELRRIDRRLELLNQPLPKGLNQLSDMGENESAGRMSEMVRDIRVWRELVIYRLRQLDAVTGRKRTWMP